MYVTLSIDPIMELITHWSQQLIDPKVKKMLLLVFHAWSLQYKVSAGWDKM